ncbi:mechanosensitive ion channel domain-containing protein [Marinobacter sp. CHS3-4]|uniref:mechanosensitive ion channel family protein n=1 Tax=Marinobacter sp. CHS3-4 TaxID=3045174 RepID=UPI0024B60F8B|nr:mechanosensitive ion channel domain-containing protein [Marinobacter sp. CHS3-4]MDI9244601.1 mechanosensitive ion channel [Marinobacter sp. CHS3-4]
MLIAREWLMVENWQDWLVALQEIRVSDVIPQVAVLLFAGLAAFFLNRYIARHTAGDTQGVRHITQRTIQRLAFPLSMLLVVLLGRPLLAALDQPHWALDLAVPLLISSALIRTLVYMLRKGMRSGPLVKASENFISTFIWLVVGLYLLGLLPGLLAAMDSLAISVGELRITLLAVIKLLVLLGLLLVVAIWLSGMIDRRLSKLPYLSAGAAVGLAKVSKLVLITVAALSVLNLVGIDLTTLAVFGGALGVGLGFGLQRIASNFISGFILVFDRSIRPGDVISIGEKFGWVVALHARYLVVRNRDGVDTLIPNENLITTEVINWSYSDPNVRLKIPVSVSYSDDVERAMAIMLEIAQEHPRVISEPEPACRLTNFGDHGIHLEVRVWVADPEAGFGSVRSDISLEIWRRFKQEGITIPFPQQDVYIKEMPAK